MPTRERLPVLPRDLERVLPRVELRAPAVVTSRVPFVVTVDVQPLSPGRPISVSVEEKWGAGPASTLGRIEVAAIEGDTAFASFQLALRERGTVLLLATAYDDAGSHFHPDGAVVEVL